MNPFQMLAKAAEQRANKYGAQYITFAIFGIINFPLALLYEIIFSASNKGLLFRIIISLLFFVFLFNKFWPKILHKYIALFWYFLITLSLPTFATFMLLSNKISLGWLMNYNIGVMIVILLLDWFSFIVVEIVGISLGVIIFYINGSQFPSLPNDANTNLFFYMFFCIIVLGSIFTRNREIHNNYLQKLKDELNMTLEEKISERTKELSRALAAKTEILNNISHEIRTPVHGFTVISEALDHDWHLYKDNKRHKYVKEIAKNAQRLSILLTNLLDLSKFRAGKMLLDFSKFELSELIEEILDEARALYVQNAKIKLSFKKTKQVFIEADKERIMQVIRNLIINAIKFSLEDNVIKLNLALEDNMVTFSIRDNGCGIPNGELNEIFQPFAQSTRTKTKAGGTGLGLAICREIISEHRGKIWAENNKDHGSIFYFSIPLVHKNESKKIKIITTDPAIENIPKKESATILIVDDESVCLDTMEMIVLSTKHKLIKAAGGKTGLEILKSHNNQIDLILLDLMMPDMYGLNVLYEIKKDEKLKNIPVVLQTGVSDRSEIDKALKYGAVAYIKKPYQRQEVLSVIDKFSKN